MKNNTKKSVFKKTKITKSFTGRSLTKYSGLEPIMNYIHKIGIPSIIDEIFPTKIHNATKHTNTQVILSFVLGSLSNISRMSRIETFTSDILVEKLLSLKNKIDESILSARIKDLGQAGAFMLQGVLFKVMNRWLTKSSLESLTIDMDSTVCGVYGSQEGAAKGYNPNKKGQKSYHNLLCFASEMKLILNSWFRTGSAYTANGACTFIEETLAILPEKIKKIFLRCDSGFFDGKLFDLIEAKGHDYLVKVKMKGLELLLRNQQWEAVDEKISQTGFYYQCKDWNKRRKLKAVRTLTGYKELEMFDRMITVPEYSYACYCSNLEGMSGEELHELYKKRGESENWIEQAKNQLLASKTLTHSFHANDILWQLSILAYNISVMVRYETNQQLWRQEHKTFREWFIELPGKVVESGRQIKLKIYQHYYHKATWLDLDRRISLITA